MGLTLLSLSLHRRIHPIVCLRTSPHIAHQHCFTHPLLSPSATHAPRPSPHPAPLLPPSTLLSSPLLSLAHLDLPPACSLAFASRPPARFCIPPARPPSSAARLLARSLRSLACSLRPRTRPTQETVHEARQGRFRLHRQGRVPPDPADREQPAGASDDCDFR